MTWWQPALQVAIATWATAPAVGYAHLRFKHDRQRRERQLNAAVIADIEAGMRTADEAAELHRRRQVIVSDVVGLQGDAAVDAARHARRVRIAERTLERAAQGPCDCVQHPITGCPLQPAPVPVFDPEMRPHD